MVSFPNGGRILLFNDRVASSILNVIKLLDANVPRFTCKRKIVAASLFSIDATHGSIDTLCTYNGPVLKDHECENIEGSCGCAHVEPRLILQGLRLAQFALRRNVLYCQYSPCTHCANIIIDSKIIDVFIFREPYRDIRGLELISSAMKVGLVKELEEGNYASIEKWVSDNR